MANDLAIPSGTRLNIAFDVPPGSTPVFNMTCTFFRALDESAFLISIPMVGGQILPLDDTKKYLIRYTQGNENRILAAYSDDIVREGIRRFWKMRRVSEARTFFQRKDERCKVTMRATYTQPTWPVNDQGVITPEDIMTLDISAGGLAVYINSRYDVGEIIHVTLPRVGISPEGAAIKDLASAICWYREAPKGSLYRHICGLQFRFGVDEQRKQLENYIANLKKVYKL